MKSIIKTDSKDNSSTYPKLMKSNISGLIVLFTKEGSGTVLFSNDTNICPIGHVLSNSWGLGFSDFTGVIELSN